MDTALIPRTRKIVRWLADKPSVCVVVSPKKHQDQATSVLAADSSGKSGTRVAVDQAWIKLSIANILNREIPDEHVKVQVDTVDYGVWLWDGKEQIHVHTPVKDLKSKVKVGQDVKKFISDLPIVKMTWDDVRKWRGIEL